MQLRSEMWARSLLTATVGQDARPTKRAGAIQVKKSRHSRQMSPTKPKARKGEGGGKEEEEEGD